MKPITIRLTDEEKQDALSKAEQYGLPTLSALIRFAIKMLRRPKNG